MNSIIVADCGIEWRERSVTSPWLRQLHVTANFIEKSSLIHVSDSLELNFLKHLPTNHVVLPELLSTVRPLTSDITCGYTDIEVVLALRLHDPLFGLLHHQLLLRINAFQTRVPQVHVLFSQAEEKVTRNFEGLVVLVIGDVRILHVYNVLHIE